MHLARSTTRSSSSSLCLLRAIWTTSFTTPSMLVRELSYTVRGFIKHCKKNNHIMPADQPRLAVVSFLCEWQVVPHNTQSQTCCMLVCQAQHVRLVTIPWCLTMVSILQYTYAFPHRIHL